MPTTREVGEGELKKEQSRVVDALWAGGDNREEALSPEKGKNRGGKNHRLVPHEHDAVQWERKKGVDRDERGECPKGGKKDDKRRKAAPPLACLRTF